MRRSNTKTVLTACQMAFEGKTNEEISEALGVHRSTLTKWRKNSVWSEFENELIKAHKESLLEPRQLETTLEDST